MAAEHYSVTKSMVLSNKHVFVEKPFVLDVEEAEELIQLSEILRIRKKRNSFYQLFLELSKITVILKEMRRKLQFLS